MWLHNPRLMGTLLAASGAMVLSFDALLVRLVDLSGPDVMVWRGLFIALSLTLVLRFWRGEWVWKRLQQGGVAAWWIALNFGLTSFLFVLAVVETAAANVLVIITTAPLFAALFSGVWLREWIALRTWIIMLICFLAIFGIFAGSLEAASTSLLGNLYAVLAAISLGLNLTLLRRHQQVSYLSVVAVGGLLGALLALPLATPWAVSWSNMQVLLIMGLQMPLAMLLLTRGLRYLPAAEVALFLVLEAIFGTLWVWWILAEAPPSATLLGGTVIILALLAHVYLGLRAPRPGYGP